jgi:hypothetical protein
MGTDYEEFRKPCPCGQGTIRVGCGSPDHGWPSIYSIHWDANIECPACQQTYTVDGTDQAMRVVWRADLAAVGARRSAYDAQSSEFMASPAVAALKTDFAAHLDGMRSVAAIHRYLEANGMVGYAIGTFRKNWRGGDDWVNRNGVGVWNVGRIAALLGRDPQPFAATLAQIEAMKASIGSVQTIMARITERDVGIP